MYEGRSLQSHAGTYGGSVPGASAGGSGRVANPYLQYLPGSQFFDPGVAAPTEWDGVGQYMRPSKFSVPRYTPVDAAAPLETSADASTQLAQARERAERQREHGRLVEYRKRLGLDGPQEVPEHLRNYVVPERVRHVPYVVRSRAQQPEVDWSPPPEERERPVDISTADAVTAPVAAQALSPESPEMVRRIVAYDDGDPFAFPVRTLAGPSPDTGVPHPSTFSTADLRAVNLPHKVLFIAPDRMHVYQVMTSSPQDGWSVVPLKGVPPPPNSFYTPVGSSHIAAFCRGDRVYMLTLQTMTWGVVIVPQYKMEEEPVFAHGVSPEDPMALYVRGITTHFVVTFHRVQAMEHDDVRAGEEIIGIHRYWLNAVCKKLRSHVVDDILEPVAGALGIATATTVGKRGEPHTWIFRYEPKAFNWLPHERIEFGNPVGVVLGRKLLFFANDTSPDALRLAEGRQTGTCVVAHMNLETGEVRQTPTTGDVRVMVGREEIAALVPTHRAENAVLCIVADMRSYIVLEVDRWEKIKTLAFSDGQLDYFSRFDADMVR